MDNKESCCKIWLFVVAFFAFLYSCSPTKRLSDGQYMLTENSISIHYPDSVKKSDKVVPYDLERFIPLTQTPNKRILGMPLFLNLYNLSNPDKDNGFQRFLRKIGEPPTLIDTTIIPNITKEMSIYMASRGFWNSSVKSDVEYRKKRGSVSYTIDASKPFKISSVDYKFNDVALKPLILSDSSQSFVKEGNLLDRELLDSERSRIVDKLVNMGYYKFAASDISYLVDTLNGNYEAKVEMIVGKVNNNYGDTIVDANEIYRIRNIYVNTNFHATQNPDTLLLDTISVNGLNFMTEKGMKQNLHHSVINNAITLYPNAIYSKDEIKNTSANISNLKFFKSANILFKEVESQDSDFVTFIDGDQVDSQLVTPEGYVDCTILCTPAKKQNYSIDFELSTNSNYTGLALTVGYGNKNIFRRAERLDISATTSYDFMRSKSSNDSYQFGASAALTFPRLAIPKFVFRYKNLYNVSSTVEISANSQRRPDYDKISFNGAFGYNWTSHKMFKYTFKPINISLIQVPRIEESFLANIENPYLRSSYDSQMILGMLGSFSYNNERMGLRNVHKVRINAESSGNFLNMMSHLTDAKLYIDENGNDYFKLFGIKYSQYIRSDISYVYNHSLGLKSVLATRLYAGGGYSYGNRLSMPFERLFFAGGSNSMRGWQVRELGPGATKPITNDDSYSDQVGNIRLEANIEGRFPIWGPVNGAVFLDAGNIWYNGKGSSITEESRLEADTFLEQIALNTGVGARLDFGYFVLRLDWGVQLYSPGMDIGSRWVIRSFKFDNSALHFAIGYPF